MYNVNVQFKHVQCKCTINVQCECAGNDEQSPLKDGNPIIGDCNQ